MADKERLRCGRSSVFERGASVLGFIVTLGVVGVVAFAAFRYYDSHRIKSKLEDAVNEIAERAIQGEAPDKIRAALHRTASEYGCAAAEEAIKIGIDPPGRPTRATVALECSVPMDFLVGTIRRTINIVKTRERSGAHRTMEQIRGRVERAFERRQEKTDTRGEVY